MDLDINHTLKLSVHPFADGLIRNDYFLSLRNHWETRSSPSHFFLSLFFCFMDLPHVCVTYCSLKSTCNITCIVIVILYIPSSCQDSAKYSSSSQDTWRGSIKYLGKQTCLSAKSKHYILVVNSFKCTTMWKCDHVDFLWSPQIPWFGIFNGDVLSNWDMISDLKLAAVPTSLSAKQFHPWRKTL
jgi:hypothetical protein